MSTHNPIPPKLTEKDIVRFWSKVDRSGDGCWLWIAKSRIEDYGVFAVENGTRHCRASRIAVFIVTGIWPSVAMHECDNPPCCRVESGHLRPGTDAENVADQVKKDRTAKGDNHGSHVHPECWPRGDQHWTKLLPHRVACGERSGTTELTANRVRAIRAAVASGELKSHVAKRFGVSPSCVGRIVARKTWNSVD